MKHTTLVGIFALILTLIPSLLSAENLIDESKKPAYLLVLSGASGSFEGDKLTLNGVPNVVYFSDQPARKAGHISIEEFLESWNKGNNSFKEDPPNAVFSILSGKRNENIVVEILNASMEDNSLSLNIGLLNGTIPNDFKQSSLFIDEIINGGAWSGT